MTDQPATISALIREIEQMLGADQTLIVHPEADIEAIASYFPSLEVLCSDHVPPGEVFLINHRMLQDQLNEFYTRPFFGVGRTT